MKFLRALAIAALAAQASALTIGGQRITIERDSDGLQDIVSTPSFYTPRGGSYYGSTLEWPGMCVNLLTVLCSIRSLTMNIL
jgi:hypothetical protein